MAAAYWKLPTRRWLLATRASTAPGSRVSRRTWRPVATTASERVVGMPSACIASLTTYSRSIGPTAARPSPPRANGVRPDPFRCRSRSRPSASTSSPSSSARPSPEPRGVPAELVPGVGLGHRGGPVRHRGCRPAAAGRRRCAASPGRGRARRQRLVEHQQPRVGRLLGLPGQRQLGQFAGEAAVQTNGRGGGDAHPVEGTYDVGGAPPASRPGSPATPGCGLTGSTARVSGTRRYVSAGPRSFGKEARRTDVSTGTSVRM